MFPLCFPVHAPVSSLAAETGFERRRVLAAACWVPLSLLTATSVVEFLIWLWFPHTNVPSPTQKKGKRWERLFIFQQSSLLAPLDYRPSGCSTYKRLHELSRAIANLITGRCQEFTTKRRKKNWVSRPAFFFGGRSITVYKSQLCRIMWQETWLMSPFEELRIAWWEIAHFDLFLIFIIIRATNFIFFDLLWNFFPIWTCHR